MVAHFHDPSHLVRSMTSGTDHGVIVRQTQLASIAGRIGIVAALGVTVWISAIAVAVRSRRGRTQSYARSHSGAGIPGSMVDRRVPVIPMIDVHAVDIVAIVIEAPVVATEPVTPSKVAVEAAAKIAAAKATATTAEPPPPNRRRRSRRHDR